MTVRSKHVRTTFIGAENNRLVADVYGAKGLPVLLLHGGGQTRRAWSATADVLAHAGWVATTLDQRGHGDSDWVDSGAYTFADFAADLRIVTDALAQQSGMRPVVIGASLGGIAALIAEGEASLSGHGPLFAALVLVDITPRVDRSGIAKIRAFMSANVREGFASIAEAADAVSAYLPHRPRPRSHQGLKKNLRLHPDGRWRWHWDPRFIDGPRAFSGSHSELEDHLVAMAQRLSQPTLLVRGGASEVVQEAHAREFLELVPHAEYLDVSDARHMVAGDRNDDFAAAIVDFLARLPPSSAG